MQVIFDHVEQVARSIQTFWFKPEQPVRYIAGQFTELYLPQENADSRGIRRWFTLSSSPTEPLLGITTKLAAADGSTFKHALTQLKPGTEITLAEPMGDFVLPKDPTIPIIFVAGGMGITPVRSMIKWLSDSGEKRNVHLMYAVTDHAELAFEPLFKDYGLTYTPVVKNPSKDHDGQTGLLSVERILDLAGDDGRSRLYLSGPELMVETFFKQLRAKNFSEDRLVTDYFPGYPQL